MTSTNPGAPNPVVVGYNILNLPAKASQSGSFDTTVLYLADGTKLAVLDDNSSAGTLYYGPFRVSGADYSVMDVIVAGGRAVNAGSGFAMHYYTTDHLGSVRLVTDASGNILEQFDYLPFGERCINSSLAVVNTGKTDYLYGGKELPQLFGINWYDSVARWQTTSGVFTSPDPLMEKYYSVSPYAYCAGNPIALVDTDGQKLYFAKGSSDAFKKTFADAVKIMNEKGTSDNLAAIDESSATFFIQESTTNNYDPQNRIIYWNPHRALESQQGLLISPLTLLAHEASHASAHADAIMNNIEDSFTQSVNTPDEQYDNIEEKRVITGDEQVAAQRHGEISNNQITRTEHQGYSVRYITGSMQEILDYIVNNNVALPF